MTMRLEPARAEIAALTVNEVIRRCPATVEVFRRHGIDACCGGAVPVADAAARHGASAVAVIAELCRVVAAAE